MTSRPTPEYIIDIDEVRAILTSDEAVLVSIRSWVEYTGQIGGYDRLEARGRIAGALWGHASSTPNQMMISGGPTIPCAVPRRDRGQLAGVGHRTGETDCLLLWHRLAGQ